MKLIQLLSASVLVAMLQGCLSGPDQSAGFNLPDGDPEKGKTVIFRHHCLSCHAIKGLEAETASVQQDIEKRIPLGGKVTRVVTYGDLVTSIINPSHRIARSHYKFVTDENGQSIMRNYNDVMSVTELIDLVAHLQPLYQVKPCTETPYNPYIYP